VHCANDYLREIVNKLIQLVFWVSIDLLLKDKSAMSILPVVNVEPQNCHTQKAVNALGLTLPFLLVNKSDGLFTSCHKKMD